MPARDDDDGTCCGVVRSVAPPGVGLLLWHRVCSNLRADHADAQTRGSRIDARPHQSARGTYWRTQPGCAQGINVFPRLGSQLGWPIHGFDHRIQCSAGALIVKPFASSIRVRQVKQMSSTNKFRLNPFMTEPKLASVVSRDGGLEPPRLAPGQSDASRNKRLASRRSERAHDVLADLPQRAGRMSHDERRRRHPWAPPWRPEELCSPARAPRPRIQCLTA